MWVFYYAMYGPGHQGNDSDFEYFGDNYSKESIKDKLMAKFSDQYDVILEWWKVDKPHASALNIAIGTAKVSIQTYTEYLRIMERQRSFIPDGTDRVDEVFQRNLKGKIDADVLRRLHKAGFMYRELDIAEWGSGREWLFPEEPDRSKILRIIRKSESYPSMESQLKRK